MLDFTVIANAEEGFTAVAFQDVLQLYTIGAKVFVAFDTGYLFGRFLILLTHHCFALDAVNRAADLATEDFLAFKARTLASSAEILAASMTFEQAIWTVLSSLAFPTGG